MTSSLLQRAQLQPYQQRMIDLAQSTPSMGLFMEPGLGKTVTALTIISEQFKGKTLVIAPKRVAENVWSEEIKKWEHLRTLKLSKVLGTASQRLAALKQNSDIYVVNLENFVWLLETGATFQNLVIDESSRFKDPSTKRFKALKKHLKSFSRKLILTGTPSPQGIGDLWAQVGILDLGQRMETSLTKFRDKYMMPDQMNRHTRVVYSWKPKEGTVETIQQKISDICFSLKAEDYLKMPACQKITHDLEMSKQEVNHYETLKKELVLDLEDQAITAPTAAVLAGKLLQFTSGAIYTEEGDWLPTNNAKLEFLDSLLEGSATPTLIFYHFKHSLERIKEAFPEAQILSDANMQAWRDGKIRILLAHPQSGGIGLNLQCNAGETAQTVWFDLPWSSENYIQANARIYRQGQTKPVIIHHLAVKGSIDHHVMDVLDGKINLQSALMESLKCVSV
jgi:SNF2 family DNA or RNA helicase